jgi:5-methylcytosine-specific restriction endonuclease McrA
MKKDASHDSPYAASAPHARSKQVSRTGGRKRGGRKKKPAAKRTHHELTSHPTTRNAQVSTRAWLLKHYGPYCAYCGIKVPAREITLDHVAPRRGQTAYDRRDNLVLACRPCNALKRDQAPLAFLLGVRSRAVHLLRYGAHLSAGLLDLARPLVRLAESSPERESSSKAPARIRWNASEEGGPSPYRNE